MRIETFPITLTPFRTDVTCRVMLPRNYDESDRRYPVIYVQDGQVLFRDADEMPGCALKESMRYAEYYEDYWRTLPQIIIVGVDCLPDGKERTLTYSPPASRIVRHTDGREEHFDGCGDRYADWLVHELKPRIDSTYRTLPDKETTAIGGFSSGASAALYILLSHPETFTRIFMLGSAVWLWDFYFDQMIEKNSVENIKRLYMLCGTNEVSRIGSAEWTLSANRRVFNQLLRKGVPQDASRFYEIKDGYHAVSEWRPMFPDALRWLFPDF